MPLVSPKSSSLLLSRLLLLLLLPVQLVLPILQLWLAVILLSFYYCYHRSSSCHIIIEHCKAELSLRKPPYIAAYTDYGGHRRRKWTFAVSLSPRKYHFRLLVFLTVFNPFSFYFVFFPRVPAVGCYCQTRGQNTISFSNLREICVKWLPTGVQKRERYTYATKKNFFLLPCGGFFRKSSNGIKWKEKKIHI